MSALEQEDIRAAFELVEKKNDGRKITEEEINRKFSAPVGKVVV
jgi:hypothetical protein